jgi:hypothetical protein
MTCIVGYLTNFVRLIITRELPCSFNVYLYTGYFTSDNEPDGIGKATHTTLPKKLAIEI